VTSELSSLPNSHSLSFSTGSGSPISYPVDRTRQLTERAPSLSPDPFPTSFLFLTDALDTYKAGQAALLTYGIKGKTPNKFDKTGLLFRASDYWARRLYTFWDPMAFPPPVHIFKYDSAGETPLTRSLAPVQPNNVWGTQVLGARLQRRGSPSA